MRRLIAVMAVFSSLAVATPAEATAPPQAVTIGYAMVFTGPNTAAGTWFATGAITGSGTVAETFTVSHEGQVAHITRTLTSATGTITIRTTPHLVDLSSTVAMYEGPWHVQSATGSYAGLTGGGTFIAHLNVSSAPPTFAVNEMEGSLHAR